MTERVLSEEKCREAEEKLKDLCKKFELVSIPTDAILEIREDEASLIRITLGESPDTDHRLYFTHWREGCE